MKKTLNEEYPKVDPKLYPNINFVSGVVGNINPSLLSDINSVAKNVGVTVTIKTAVEDAVDISMFNNKEFSNQKDAINKGIDRVRFNFVNGLIKLGYLYNQVSSNDKSVLSFGLQGYDDRIHVSRKSSVTQPNTDNKPTTNEPVTTITTTGKSGDRHNDYSGILNNIPGLGLAKAGMEAALSETNSIDDIPNRLNEEITRIKKMMK